MGVWFAMTLFFIIQGVHTGLISDFNLFGEEFVIAFHNTPYANDSTILRISNPKAGRLSISVKDSGNPANESFDTALSLYLYMLCDHPLPEQDVCLVTVSSTTEIEVLVINDGNGQPYYNSVPSSKLGMDYFTETRFMKKQSMCDIVTVQPFTKIQFNLNQHSNVSVSLDGKHVNCKKDLCSLVISEKAALVKLRSERDFSGLRISGNKPFALFCGGQTSEHNSSVIMNQLMPVGMYGLSYATWPAFSRGYVTVLAACDHTDVFIYDTHNQTISDMDSGSSQEHYVEAKHQVIIQSNKPVAAMQSWRLSDAMVNIQKTVLLPLVTTNETCVDDDLVSKTDLFTTLSPAASEVKMMVNVSPSVINTSFNNDYVTRTSECHCSCHPPASYLKSSELASKLKQLSKNTLLNKENLSRTLRKRRSATDDRPTAKGIGILGAAVLFGVVGFIVVMDFPNLIAQVQLFRYGYKPSNLQTQKYNVNANFFWKKTMVKQMPDGDPRLTIIDYEEDEF